MMRITTVSRRQLLDILQALSSTGPESRPSELPLSFDNDAGPVKIAWRESQEKTSVPGLILVEKSRQRDFFAWAATFIPSLRPLSAFFRVIDPSVLESLEDQAASTVSPKLYSAFIGTILAETATPKIISKSPVRISVRESLGTASYCLSRTISLGLLSHIHDVVEAWGTAKDLIENRRPAYFGEIRSVWDVITALSNRKLAAQLTNEQELLSICCADIMEDGEISPSNWRELTSKTADLGGIEKLIEGTREERVLSLERLLGTVVRATAPGRIVKAFLCGYLTSLVAPGTLDHIGLLSQVVQPAPAAPLWYGLCAGLKGGEGVQAYSGGMGRRVARELMRRTVWTDAPACDIAVGELVVLMPNGRPAPEWLRTDGPNLDVEVAPGVTCSLRQSDSDRDAGDGPRLVHPNDLGRLYERITDISLRLQDVQREVNRLRGSEQTKQRGKAQT